MSVSRKLVLAALVACISFALAGCEGGVTAKVAYDFKSDGAFTQSLDMRGVQLSEQQLSDLKTAGWTVKQSASGFTAKSVFPSAEKYSEPAGALYTALNQSFVDGAGYDPQMSTDVTVRHAVTNMIIAERHEVNVTVPVLDLSPTECPTCGGQGSSDCPDCNGGTQTCSSCGGTGGYNGWYGWEDCWDCSGTGEVSCSTCGGSGTVSCSDCDGTGDAPEWIQAAYDESISGSRLDVAINMPGFTVKDAKSEAGPWKLKGSDIEAAESFSATSYVVNWLYAGIAAAVLLIIVVLVVWLIVRSVKRALRKPVAVVSVQPAVVAAAAAPTASAETCASCGAALTPGAKFCRACGAQAGNGES